MNIGLGPRRKTILLIDADSHARGLLRKALEAARFSVGEAASDREGERTALRIKPDAVIAELLLDPGETGLTIAERLNTDGNVTPCYILSSAADALVGAVGLHEMRLSGVFLKPADAALIVQTLKTRLGMPAAEPPDA